MHCSYCAVSECVRVQLEVFLLHQSKIKKYHEVTQMDPTNRRTIQYYLSLRWLCTSVICLFVVALVGWAEVVMVLYILSTTFKFSILLGILQFAVWHLLWVCLVVSYLKTVFTG